MIYLRTGLPGSGKTLRTIWEAMATVESGREVYALNVNGLDYEFTGIKPAPIDDLSEWQSLPPGCVLIVDECQRYLPPTASNVKQPDWVEALTRNRHAGIDLHLVTQHPRLINYYVRELVNYHEHLTRLEGNFPSARVYYSEGLLDLGRKGPPKHAAFRLWRYPKDVFGVYKSAEVHTVKRYIPQKLKFVAAGAVFVALAIWGAVAALDGIKSKPSAVEPEPVAVATAAPAVQTLEYVTPKLDTGGGRDRPVITTAAEYAAAHTPLIEGMPWTAPAFVGREVTAEPEIFCMSSEAKGCRCVTEQGTKVYIREAVCRTIVREGVYNPYRRPYRAPGAMAGERSALDLAGRTQAR